MSLHEPLTCLVSSLSSAKTVPSELPKGGDCLDGLVSAGRSGLGSG